MDDLVARCREFGAPKMSKTVIAHIESGRPLDGRRRRDVTVDELLVLAQALAVPPMWLCVPLDGAELVEITPECVTDPLYAVAWFPGEDDVPAMWLRPPVADDGKPGFEVTVLGPDDQKAWDAACADIYAIRRLWNAVHLAWLALEPAGEQSRSERLTTAAGEPVMMRTTAENAVVALKEAVQDVKGRGFALPVLPPEVAALLPAKDHPAGVWIYRTDGEER
jgi:hypothetical protein